MHQKILPNLIILQSLSIQIVTRLLIPFTNFKLNLLGFCLIIQSIKSQCPHHNIFFRLFLSSAKLECLFCSFLQVIHGNSNTLRVKNRSMGLQVTSLHHEQDAFIATLFYVTASFQPMLKYFLQYHGLLISAPASYMSPYQMYFRNLKTLIHLQDRLHQLSNT